MAGHNKWSKVKHIKGAADAKRGKIFSRLSREISIAARVGGGDIAMNARLRSAVANARAQNMPNDTIDRAIKKGTGEGGSAAIEEILYEGYAPGGVAVLVEAATDNKNRTAAEVRLIFTKNHGSLGTSGSVSYLFQRKGRIAVEAEGADEDAILEAAIEAGADEMVTDDGQFVITTPFERFYAVAESLRKAGVTIASQELAYLPATTVPVTDESLARQILRLCGALEDCEDVQNVFANFEIDDALIEQLTA